MKSVFCNNENTLKLKINTFIIKEEMLPIHIKLDKTSTILESSKWKGYFEINCKNLKLLSYYLFKDMLNQNELDLNETEIFALAHDIVFDIIDFNSYMIGDLAGYREFNEILKDFSERKLNR